jgi:hypothetical protein
VAEKTDKSDRGRRALRQFCEAILLTLDDLETAEQENAMLWEQVETMEAQLNTLMDVPSMTPVMETDRGIGSLLARFGVDEEDGGLPR